MKKSKFALSLILVLALCMQLCSVSFAANVGTICYQTEGLNVSATVAITGLPEEAKLVTAVYDINGNVVASNISKSVKDVTDAVLKTNVTKSAETDTVKSYIWTNEENSPLSKAGVLGYQATADDLKIYFDGVPFATAAGEALSFDKASYTVNLSDPDGDGKLNFPKVTYEVEDKTIDLDITHDYEALTSTIIIESGVRQSTAVEATNGKTATYYTYSKPFTKTITISYVQPQGTLTNEDFISASLFGIAGANSLTLNTYYYDYVLGFDKAEAAAAELVEFTVTGLVNADSIIVIKPKNADATASYKDAIVNSDGSALSWEADDKIVYAYDYAGTTDAEKLVEAWDETRATYGERAVTNPVSITYDGSTEATSRIIRRVQDSDNYFVTGNYSRYNDRYPNGGQIEFITPNADLLNCNYITFPNKDLKAKELKFSFYVNQSVDVHVVTRSNAAVVKKTAAGSVAATAVKAGSGFARRYQNTIPPASLAWLVANGYANINDLCSYNATVGRTYSATIDDVTYSFKTNQIYIKKWASIHKLDEAKYSAGLFLTGDACELLGYKAASGSTATAKTYDISAVWNNKTPADLSGIQAIVDKFVSFDNELGKERPVITNPVMCSGYISDDGKTVDFALIDATSTKSPVPKVFPDTASGNRSFFTERDGLNRNNLTGLILEYEEAYDLEDGVFLQAMMRAPEGTTTVHKTYYNTKQVPFYTFKVNYDCEVKIVYNGGTVNVAPLLEDGYTLNTFTAVKNMYSAPSNIKTFNKVYTKTFSKGDTVTVYTPGDPSYLQAPYVACFVKPLNN